MRYWDSSAVVPLLVKGPETPRVNELVGEDAALVTWWGTQVECVSALARLERDGRLAAEGIRQALTRLRRVSQGWIEVPASEAVRDQAKRLLRVHPLRAADALQLAAAIVAADHRPGDLEIVTLDTRQAQAAEREGFRILG